jgi:hypothetical protein
LLCAQRPAASGETAAGVLETAGVRAGLCVHLGGEGAAAAALTVDLARAGQFVIHHLSGSPASLTAARQAIRAAGLYGSVSAEAWSREELPYADRLVNLLIVEPDAKVARSEIERVLRPDGVALTRQGAAWAKFVAPWPPGMDEWTHHKHGPDGNPVSQDTIEMTRVPSQMRWVADTLQLWSHGVRAVGGRLFIFDKGAIRARDAFNGTLLWAGTPGISASSSPGTAYGRPIATADLI